MTFSAMDFKSIFKKNKDMEIKIFFIIISIISGYLLTNFVIDFVKYSSII